MSNHYRPTTPSERAVLAANGCTCADWEQLKVSTPFTPGLVRNVAFGAQVCLGKLGNNTTGGIEPGLCNTTLDNVTLGDNCRIFSVPAGICNATIGNEVIIENTGRIICQPGSSFGHGVKCRTLNEGGGREITLTRYTSAQIAYLSVLYRHDPLLTAALEQLAQQHCALVTTDRLAIGDNTTIRDCTTIESSHIGAHATFNGALAIKNCWVESSADAPTHIGGAVMLTDSIVLRGAKVSQGALIERSLIGEGCHVDKGFSSLDSLFFANSDCAHSEACSVFGGPFTVTHHRATLLIAGMFSFYNAGSATNQSNHLYKLGPLHQGILERGCKTGSGAYTMFPARIGAFTLILGKHASGIDTANLPFSLLLEKEGNSILMPAMNLFTAGTMRDGTKWSLRDRRTHADPLDLIHPAVFTPFTAQKMIKGGALLEQLVKTTAQDHDYAFYKGVRIKRLLLANGAKMYRLGLALYTGSVLLKRAQQYPSASWEELMQKDPLGYSGDGDWVDIAGMIVPFERIGKLCATISTGAFDNQPDLLAALRSAHASYPRDEWNWFVAQLDARSQSPACSFTSEQRRDFFTQWFEGSTKQLTMVLADADKEFAEQMQTGYGIDGFAEQDFRAVRGQFKTNAFVLQVKSELETLKQTYNRAIDRFCHD